MMTEIVFLGNPFKTSTAFNLVIQLIFTDVWAYNKLMNKTQFPSFVFKQMLQYVHADLLSH